jgi:glycosyltransferase involved in cell wall biosynthesis
MKIGKLLIISHTEHYRTADGSIVGWGPTIREINHLLDVFDEIWHIGVLHAGLPPQSSMPYVSDRIHFVPIKPFGGRGIIAKLGILLHLPILLATVIKTLKQVDYWQFRAPTGIGVFLIPYLSVFVRKTGWFKYAGNWNQSNPPLGYRFQRFWLTNLQSRTVTINGRWPDQPAHCLSFENPCLDTEELAVGLEAIAQKKYDGPFEVCFIGRVEPEKGVLLLLEAVRMSHVKDKLKTLHIIGEGRALHAVQKTATTLQIEVKIYGSLNRIDVVNVLQKCHFNVLPSASEGFPKVIAEGEGYGCIPIVSAVSSFGQYVKNEENGFLLEPETLTPTYIAKRLLEAFEHPDLRGVALKAYGMAEKFTFDFYNERIKQIVYTSKQPM